jgi:cytochrome c oxidase cbb3-type subunit 3
MFRSIWTWIALGAVIGIGCVYGLQRSAERHLAARLLGASTEAIAGDPQLLQFAQREARPLYATHCAACHGADLTGNAALGAPNLTDAVWLFGKGSIFDIERTLLYGIRSTAPQSRNVTDMPAYGLRGMLTSADISNTVQYLLQVNRRPYQPDAANEGRQVYQVKGNCQDCHGADLHGNPDYGAPDLTVNVWNSGSDSQSLYRAIYAGQHHVMPAWFGTLTLEQIRALAVYVYSASHPTMRR